MIKTKLISVPKKNSGGGGTTIIKSGSSGGSGGGSNNFEPHYLWGQYFDDTQDITGDLKNVANIYASGNINCDGTINADAINANSLDIKDGITVDDLTTDTLQANTFRGVEVATEKLYVGDPVKGRWIIEEDNDVNLNIHIDQDKELHIQPNDEDIFSVSNDKVKVAKQLDLVNEREGSSMMLGQSTIDSKNTNVKTIVEDGIYFVDNNNNVALGISNNYVAAAADIGSPNFLSGSYGWRVQPDGTGEFQNLKVNGNLDVFVLTYNEMRATNGILLVTDCACVTDAIDKTISNVYYWIITVDEYPPFAINDYVQLQYRVDDTRIFSFKGIVTALNADGKNTVRVQPLEGFSGTGTSTDDRGVTTFRTVDPATATGEYLIRIGNKTDVNRQTIIKLNPYDGGYIDFMTGLKSPNTLADSDNIRDNVPTATRIGNLSGVVYKGTTLEGYGLFSDNAYLSGAIRNLANKWALNADGSGNVAGNHIVWDADGNLTIKLGNQELGSVIQSVRDDLTGMVTTTESRLSGQISASASGLRTEFSNNLTTTRTDLEGNIGRVQSALNSKIEQTASSIRAEVSEVESDGNSRMSDIELAADKLAATVKSHTTDIGQNKTNITSLTADVSGLKTRVTSIEGANYVTQSQLTQTANSITASVSAQDYGKIKIGYKDNWEQGSTGGESVGKTYTQIKVNHNYRIRTKSVHRATTSTKIYVGSAYQVYVHYFDGNMKLAGDLGSGWKSPNTSGYIPLSMPSYAKYISLILAKSNGSAMTVSEVESANVLITTDAVMAAGEVSLMIQDGMSNFNVNADRINFKGYTNVNNNFIIDYNGNVTVKGNVKADTLSYGGVKVNSNTELLDSLASLYLITSTSEVQLTLPPPDIYNGFITEIIPIRNYCYLKTFKPTNNAAEAYLQYRKSEGGLFNGSSTMLHITRPVRVYSYNSFWYVLDGVY